MPLSPPRDQIVPNWSHLGAKIRREQASAPGTGRERNNSESRLFLFYIYIMGRPLLTLHKLNAPAVLAKITAGSECFEDLIADSCESKMSHIEFVSHGAIDRLHRQPFRAVPLGLRRLRIRTECDDCDS